MHNWLSKVHPRQVMKIPGWRLVVMAIVVFIATSCVIIIWVEQCRREPSRRHQLEPNTITQSQTNRKMAIIVPVHQGDKDRAMESLRQWPLKCHALTVQNVDLVIYQAENKTTEADLIARVTDGPSRCFRMASVVSGNLLPEVCDMFHSFTYAVYFLYDYFIQKGLIYKRCKVAKRISKRT